MPEKTEPLVQTCSDCGALIDVSEEEPFALMHCPTCGGGMRVRRKFDHFEIQETLGSGGMGAVYRALDSNLNRMVALKLLRKDYSANPEFVAQFKTEAAVTASINHPHVVKVYSSGEDHGLLYIAMELVDKGSLDELMEVEGKISEMKTLDLAIQIAEGLNAAFQTGLIHRDIKPGNILFAQDQSAKIVDFGLAALMDEATTVGGEIWGTPYYVAPEKLEDKPEDARSDIYSLGATLFHALAGRPPFEEETDSVSALRELKRKSINLESIIPEISSATAFVINKALSNDPAQRHQSYEELIKSLEYAKTELKAKQRAEAKQKAEANAPGSNDWITWTVMAGVIASGLVFYNWQRGIGASGSSTPTPAISASTPQSTIEPRFKAAREKLLAGQFADAAKAFQQLEAEPNLPQPFRNWTTLEMAIAHFLAGQNPEAEAACARIEERGIFSTEESEHGLATFFIDSAHLLRTPGPILPGQTKPFDGPTYRSLALFMAGIKNWNLGQYDQAAEILANFAIDPAQAPTGWLAEDAKPMRSLAKLHVADVKAVRLAVNTIKAANDPAKQKEALELAKTSKANLQLKSKLVDALDAAIAELEPKIAAYEEEKIRSAAEREALEMKLLSDAKLKRNTLAAQYRFIESKAAIQAPKLSLEKAKLEQEALLTKTDLLIKFKSLLIRDISVAGYSQPIARKSGPPISGTAAKADDAQIQIKTQFGFLPIAWTDVSYESALAMAISFIRPGLSPELEADRKWFIAAFAAQIGKVNESRQYFNEAAQLKTDYQPLLPAMLQALDTP